MTALASSLAREIEQAAANSSTSVLSRLRDDPERLVGVEDACKLTGLTPSSLATYRCRGKLRAVSVKRHRVRYRVADLLRYIEEGSQ